MATRPQTIGYALLDSPVALAAWLLDHDTDSYYKISRAFVDGEPVGNLTRETIVDNITLYWLTGTAPSAARSYWEDGRALAAALASGQAPPPVSVPVGFTTFPGEIWASPRSWVEAVYPDLAYFNEVDKGGHFAAWEEPELFSEELRAAFRPLRDAQEVVMSSTVETAIEIRPFLIDIPDEVLEDLRRRIAATNWPEQGDRRGSVPGRAARHDPELARYWMTDYDWRTCEASLNALPQFITEIDGLDIHFIHVRSEHEDALPLDHNARLAGLDHRAAEDHRSADRPDRSRRQRRGRIPPRDPVDAGLRLLGGADEHRLGPRAHGSSLGGLMQRLGYSRYVAQGGDGGAFVIDQMGRQAPEGLLAIHTNMLATVPLTSTTSWPASPPLVCS